MRRLLFALALVGLASEAYAGEFELPDLPILRGSSPLVPAAPTYRDWSGFYVGGEAGYGSAHMDFSHTTRQLYSLMLRQLALESEQHVSQWQVLGQNDTGGASAGGFFGYNTQWDDVILGVDVHYSFTKFFSQAPAMPIARVTSAGGNTYDVTLNGSASMAIHDWGAARVRGGYVLGGNLLPYATFGFAFGRADLTRTATADGTETTSATPPVVTPFSFSMSESRHNAWIFGWAAGGGLDMLLLPNLFVRAEYEYVSFASVAGTRAAISTGRVGAALKF